MKEKCVFQIGALSGIARFAGASVALICGTAGCSISHGGDNCTLDPRPIEIPVRGCEQYSADRGGPQGVSATGGSEGSEQDSISGSNDPQASNGSGGAGGGGNSSNVSTPMVTADEGGQASALSADAGVPLDAANAEPIDANIETDAGTGTDAGE